MPGGIEYPGGRTGYSICTWTRFLWVDFTQELESNRKQQNADTIKTMTISTGMQQLARFDGVTIRCIDIDSQGRTVWFESSMQCSANEVDHA